MSKNDFSTPQAGRGRRLAALLSVLAMTLGGVLLGSATPASAALSSVSVSAQSGTLTYGVAGNATYTVTVTRTFGSPGTFNLIMTGLPAGASVLSQSPANPVSITTASRTVTLTIQANTSVAAGSNPFSVQASGFGPDPIGGASLVVGKADQTITFGALSDQTFGDPDFSVSATSTSGLVVDFAASGNCTVAGSSVHLTGAGSCTVTASQPGDGNYNAAASVPQTFTVAKSNQTITFGPLADKNNYSPDFELTGTASSGLAVEYSASGVCTVTGALVHVTGAAGTCTIDAAQPGNVDYNAAPAGSSQSFDVVIVTPTAELFAVSGSTTLAGQPVPVWGYNTTNAAVSQPSGPTITVVEGTPVVLVLHNQLSEATSLVVRGQSLPTDRTGVPPLGTKAYLFTPTEPGTFIYEAGPIANSQHQVAMGLYGTLIVTPSSGTPYGSTNEAVVLVSEIDPALNNSVDPAAFDMRTFAPKYTLLNGTVYPASANLANADPGSTLLLRYVNAGINYHSMSILGANQQIVGDDGHALAQPYKVVAQTVGPGQTFDALVDVSPSAVAGTKLAVFDANLQLRNRNRRPAASASSVSYGGALAFVTIGGTAPTTDTAGPVASNLAATSTSITASISDVTNGNSNVTAAEYFIDAPGAAGTGTAMAGTFGAPTVAVNATFPALSPGNHTIYVRGRDAANNWGPLVSVLYTNDNQGPATTGLSLTPNPTNGAVDVALHATGSDAATGGSVVTEAEYTIDGGVATPMNLNLSAVTVSLDAAISAATVNGLAEGDHPVAIRTRDAIGNWGTTATVTLTVDKTGPTTSSVVVSPTPNNGTLGVNSSAPAVRVTATATDLASTLNRAEGFIDTVGADGTGFLFVPTDGVWNSTTESISVDIPLLTVAALPAGDHHIRIHARDAAGNWGPITALPAGLLTIDKTAPTAVSIARDGPSPATASSVSFTVTFSEAVTGVTGANFAVVQGSGLFGAVITGVTGTGATRTVTVSTGSGGGTLGLDLTSATGITDIAGNAMAATGLPLPGQVYTLTTPPLYFSTVGNTNPQGVGGTADDADIYLWSGTAFSRSTDVSNITNSIPGGANVDGYDRVDATHFYMSFTGNVTLPRPGPDLTVADEDVVYYNAGTWSLYFDGSARNVGSTDLDAISIVGGTLYFSTDNTAVPNGAGGSGDDADIYRWNGLTSFTRVFDASALGWSTTNVDGFVWVDATDFYLSYSADTTVSGLGVVQDEDVVYYNAGTWSLYFDGTGKNMTNGNLDVDGFDIP